MAGGLGGPVGLAGCGHVFVALHNICPLFAPDESLDFLKAAGQVADQMQEASGAPMRA